MILRESETLPRASAYCEVAQAAFCRILDAIPPDQPDAVLRGCASWLRSDRGAAMVTANLLRALGIKDVALIAGHWTLRDTDTHALISRLRGHIWVEFRVNEQYSWETAVVYDPWAPVCTPADCIVSPTREGPSVSYKALSYFGAEQGIFSSPGVYALCRLAFAEDRPMSDLQRFAEQYGLEDELFEFLRDQIDDDFLPPNVDEFEDPLLGIIPDYSSQQGEFRPNESDRRLN